MAETVLYVVPVEVRSAGPDSGPHLIATILQEGRAGSVRQELFTPMACIWPENGVAILTEHRGKEIARAIPSREQNGEIRIRARATPEIQEAYTTKRFMSIEFTSLSETRTASGIREIARAYVGAVAMVSNPEFVQATAEIRARNRRKVWL